MPQRAARENSYNQLIVALARVRGLLVHPRRAPRRVHAKGISAWCHCKSEKRLPWVFSERTRTRAHGVNDAVAVVSEVNSALAAMARRYARIPTSEDEASQEGGAGAGGAGGSSERAALDRELRALRGPHAEQFERINAKASTRRVRVLM